MVRGKIVRGTVALALSASLALAGCASAGAIKTGSAPAPRNSVELARAMGNGINLGNTMEAYGRQKYGTSGSVSDYETAWGQPVTTQAIVTAFKKAGFDSIRIPVAWTNMMSFEKGDYTINAAYLDRVGEIIQYALNENMYVIVNDHWDGGWWGMFGSKSEDTRSKAMALYVSMWAQIAAKYKDYPSKLIFESANEELGNRLNDVDIATDSGQLSEDACYATVNKINQAFVETVRKAGGNDTDRFLLIAGYNTDIAKTCDPRFVMPSDTAKDRLLISVHYYEPSDYCTNTSVGHWGTKDEYKKMNTLLRKMTKFSDSGYGVVIGEYAVSLKKDGSVKDNTYDYINNVLDNCDLYGYSPQLWDCSSLFKRSSLSFIDQSAAKLFADRSLAKEKGKTQDDIELAAKLSLGSSMANAAEPAGLADNVALAWIMWNSGDWGATFSVGDKYNPDSKTDGLVATVPTVTGPGTYTVALDFTKTEGGCANDVGFSAIGIANGEKLFPGYAIDIKEIVINGQPYAISGTPYTTSDDGTCTRVNLYNTWVAKIPSGVRVASGDPEKLSACLLSSKLGKVKTISISFEFKKL
jgi:Endoglucanase